MTEPIPALLDGALPLQRTEMARLLRERALSAARWFVAMQRPDGSFPYIYDPARDHYDLDEYNEVRHAGATSALMQAAGLYGDATLIACARKAARYILHSCVSTPGGGAAYLYKGRAKLGGVALAIVALLEGRKVLVTDEYDDAIAALGGFLLGLELPGEPGRYAQSFDAATQEELLTPASNYYPGEALLALARLCSAFPDGPWLAAAQRAAHYLLRVKDGDLVAANAVPRDDHWLTIALNELARVDPNPDFATVAFLQAERMIRNQIGTDDPEPWRIGAGRRNPTPSYPSTATQAEALLAAWELARRIGRGQAAERYAQAALRAAQFLMRVQYTETSCASFPHPERAIGAWPQDRDRSQIRFDFVQHGLSALIGAAHLLDATATETVAQNGMGSIEIVASKFLACHNQWSKQPILRLTIHSEFREPSGPRIEAAIERLERELGRLHSADGTVPSAERHRSDEDSLGFSIGPAVLAMQQSLGDELSFLDAWPGATTGTVEIAVAYRYEAVALAAAQVAVSLMQTGLDASPGRFDFMREFDKRVAAKHPSRACRPDVRSVLAAADRRGVPIRAVDVDRGMVTLGTGSYGRRFWNLSTSNTSAHGVRFAKDKYWASRLLRDAGVPVPKSVQVRSVDEAKRAALEIGYPVVLKPNLGSQGRDVFADLRDEAELVEVFETSVGRRSSGDWLIEQFVPGKEHRVLVVGGRVVAANLRIPASVTGDGIATVQALIDRLNADPARSFELGFALKPVVIGEQVQQMLRRQGLALDSIPDAGQAVRLNAVSNVSAGGSTMEVLDRMHPDNVRVAQLAAHVIGLDFAGIDLVVPDIAQSIWETGGAIIEINSHPGVIDHLEPGSGPARDVGAAVLDALFPPGRPVRVPVIAVLADDVSNAICQRLAGLLQAEGMVVGLAIRDGLSIDRMRFPGVDARNPFGPRTVLNNPAVDVAVVEVDVESIVDYGLGFDRCDAVIAGASSGMETPDGRSIEAMLLDALAEGGLAVLNGNDPRLAVLADDLTDGEVMFCSGGGLMDSSRSVIDRVLSIQADSAG